MATPPHRSSSLVRSYLDLRTSIGVIGIALPFALAFGKLVLEGPGLQSSISAYYYTAMRDVFVGSLCAIGVFLFSYRGYDPEDAMAGNLAALFAFGVALCPVAPELNLDARRRLIGMVHLASAAAFFLTLSYFSLVLFRKTSSHGTPTPRKLQRNRVYAACGWAMILCLVLIAAVKLLLPASSPLLQSSPVFWLEAAAIVAFGISWLTKGEAILADE